MEYSTVLRISLSGREGKGRHDCNWCQVNVLSHLKQFCYKSSNVVFVSLFQGLIIRFLKRAASNLQQPFKVVVPSQKLPLRDRLAVKYKNAGRVYASHVVYLNNMVRYAQFSKITARTTDLNFSLVNLTK